MKISRLVDDRVVIRDSRPVNTFYPDVTRHCHLSLSVMLSKRVLRAWMYGERRIYDRKRTSACSDSCRVREFRLQERFLFNVKAEMFLARLRDHWISREPPLSAADPCNRPVNVSRYVSRNLLQPCETYPFFAVDRPTPCLSFPHPPSLFFSASFCHPAFFASRRVAIGVAWVADWILTAAKSESRAETRRYRKP